MSDTQLLEGLKAGAAAALDYVYDTYFNLVFSIVKTNSGQLEDAEDLMQETLVALIKNIRKPNFKLTSKFSYYLRQIAFNKWMMELRRRKKEAQLVVITAETSLEQKKEEELRYEIVIKELEQLNEPCKTIILETKKGTNQKEIARITGLSHGNVRVKIKPCMNKLKARVLENTDYKKYLKY